MKRHAELDGLRGSLALLVVLIHAGIPHSMRLYFFMDAFFTLSAFVIAGSLREGDPSPTGQKLRDFFIRRAARILPGYYLTVLAGIGIAWLANAIARAQGRTFEHYHLANAWQYLFFFQFTPLYWLKDGSYLQLQLIDHTWSLAVEEQFYIVVGTAWIALGRPGTRALIALGCVLVGVWSRVSDIHPVLAPFHLDAFGYGLAGVLAYRAGTRRPTLMAAFRRMTGLIWPGAFALYAWLLISHGLDNVEDELRTWSPTTLLSSLGCGALVLWIAASRGAPSLFWLRHPIAQYLGRISYALYLCHHVIGSAGSHAGALKAGSPVSQIEMIALSLCCADLFTKFLESCQQRIRRRWLP